MRRTFLGLLLVVSFWVPAAWPKDPEPPPPLFMAPDFRFSQIDSICVAPAIDLRADKTEPLILSGRGPGRKFSHFENVDTRLARDFKTIGYQTVSCNPVNSSLGDLKTPTDTWLGKLDFGGSSWLFILAVEDVSTPYHRWWSMGGRGSMGGYAVVSGYLFQKQATGVRLVLRDRVAGRERFGSEVVGRKETQELAGSVFAINGGAECLLRKFEMRHKPRTVWPCDKAHAETLVATCDVVWTALNDILKNSAKYDVIGIDDSDMIAIYLIGRGATKTRSASTMSSSKAKKIVAQCILLRRPTSSFLTMRAI